MDVYTIEWATVHGWLDKWQGVKYFNFSTTRQPRPAALEQGFGSKTATYEDYCGGKCGSRIQRLPALTMRPGGRVLEFVYVTSPGAQPPQFPLTLDVKW
ncbi:hypothetical protein CASFOL_035862 [Castilleja foliolosa]|uniref:Uncharacterized protein n=1 Tax=Castilleja foliolosa TaxID=1961234 RepID=A0ABD3BW74_9LAMI